MAVTAFNGQFSFKQDSLARLGQRDTPGMNKDQWNQFQNSPFMQGVRKTEDVTVRMTSDRDRKRAQRDPSFRPGDGDFNAPKAFAYDKNVNYYKVLGIDEYSNLDEVKKAYKKLSLVYHPDKTAGLDQAQKDEYAAIFIELKNAYQTLNDGPTRRQYDRDRDRDRASFEVNGYKVREKASFDATEILKELASKRKPPGKVIDIVTKVKLEKFFFGGQKGITKTKKVKVNDAIKQQQRVYRVDIPKGASEPHEVLFRMAGDYHEETLPDSFNFKLMAKPHGLCERVKEDLILKQKVLLGSQALREPQISAETPTVRGRHLLLWGRNPFFRSGASAAELRVRVRGEGFGSNGVLRFSCAIGGGVVDEAPKEKIIRASQATPNGTPKSKETPPPPPQNTKIVVCVTHLSTNASIHVRIPNDADIACLRRKVMSVVNLPKGSTVRLVRRNKDVQGFVPWRESSAVGNNRKFTCAGDEWDGPDFGADAAKRFLQDIRELTQDNAFTAELSALRQTRSPATAKRMLDEFQESCLDILPDYGFAPSREALKTQVSAARKVLEGNAMNKLLLDVAFDVSEGRLPGAAFMNMPQVSPSVAGAGGGRASRKRFFERHGLGPPGGLTMPGSDTEAEGESSAAPRGAGDGSMHGQGGLCTKPAMIQRIKRQASRKPICEVELEPMGEPVVLFTRPTCSITFYSNMRQSPEGPPGQKVAC